MLFYILFSGAAPGCTIYQIESQPGTVKYCRLDCLPDGSVVVRQVKPCLLDEGTQGGESARNRTGHERYDLLRDFQFSCGVHTGTSATIETAEAVGGCLIEM